MKLEEKLELLMNTLYGKKVKDANVKELYNALAKAIMLDVEKDWRKTQNNNKKKCGYISAEFLIGRLIHANILNRGLMNDVKTLLAKYDLDINCFEEVEDAALGNGGLGRLAACFLESAASINVPLDGYGLRYRFGLFKQTFVNGFQNEEADDWLKWGDPFSNRVEEDTVQVKFADLTVNAVPYDMPVIGYDSKLVNTLRLWQSEPVNHFDFKLFDAMKGDEKALENNKATEITDVLYPNDNTEKGKLLRLRQEYFMVSASLQDAVKKFKKRNLPFAKFPEYQIFQLNDTHPTLAIPELIRLFQLEGLSFEESLAIARNVFNFTNHTIMGEALEKWPVHYLEELLPEILEIIYKLDEVIKAEVNGNPAYFIVNDNKVHMANLAIVVASHVNGVARIHTDILKNDTFKNWYELYPNKFVNVTNGVTPRRWLALNNPSLTAEISKRIGDDWVKNLNKLENLKPYAEDKEFLEAIKNTRAINKETLRQQILKTEGVDLPTNFMYDIQIKRLHEYKRQLLNALSILYIYNGLKDGSIKDYKPTAFIFGAKSAPGYYMAKAIIKLINTIANKVNNDPETNSLLRVVFVHNYNVSYAEKLVCAADLSEQISMAGMEASGTGNMKFMFNGTPTLGTLDGANVEICEEAGRENNYIFGATVEEVAEIKKNYNPNTVVENNPKLKAIMDSLMDGSLDDDGSGNFEALHWSLLRSDNPDHYLVLQDFASYIEAKLQANKEYGTEAYYKKCAQNLVSCAKFSSDRSIEDYNKNIWDLNL